MPGVPQDVGAVLIEHAAEKCVVTLLWRSPDNINEAYLTDYIISVNGTTFPRHETVNSNKNMTLISALLPVPSCAAYMITISAVNVCGQGPSTPNLILDPRTRHIIPNSSISVCDAKSDTYINVVAEILSSTIGDKKKNSHTTHTPHTCTH